MQINHFLSILHYPTPNLMKFGTVVGSHEYIKISNKNLGQVFLIAELQALL